jgi:hypothetical protein
MVFEVDPEDGMNLVGLVLLMTPMFGELSI